MAAVQLFSPVPEDLRRHALEGLSRLNDREIEVLKGVLDAKSACQIASATKLSPRTIETYRGRIFMKLGVGSIGELFRIVRSVEHEFSASEVSNVR